jgi:hypothetical protein
MKSSACTTSHRLSALCSTCQTRGEPCHIISPPAPLMIGPNPDTIGGYHRPATLPRFYCGKCCPVHGTPLLNADREAAAV